MKNKTLLTLLTLLLSFSLLFGRTVIATDVDAESIAHRASSDDETLTVDRDEAADDAATDELAPAEDVKPEEIKTVPVRIRVIDDQSKEAIATFYTTVLKVDTDETRELDPATPLPLTQGKYALINLRANKYATIERFEFEITAEQVEAGKEIQIEVPMTPQAPEKTQIDTSYAFYVNENQALNDEIVAKLDLRVYDNEGREVENPYLLELGKDYNYVVDSELFETKTGKLFPFDHGEGDSVYKVDIHLTAKKEISDDVKVTRNALPVAFVDEAYSVSLSTKDPGTGMREFSFHNVPAPLTTKTIYSKELVSNGGSVRPLSATGTLSGTPTIDNLGNHVIGLYLKDGAGNSAEYFYELRVLNRQKLTPVLEGIEKFKESDLYKKVDDKLKKDLDALIDEAKRILAIKPLSKDAHALTQEEIDALTGKLEWLLDEIKHSVSATPTTDATTAPTTVPTTAASTTAATTVATTATEATVLPATTSTTAVTTPVPTSTTQAIVIEPTGDGSTCATTDADTSSNNLNTDSGNKLPSTGEVKNYLWVLILIMLAVIVMVVRHVVRRR